MSKAEGLPPPQLVKVPTEVGGIKAIEEKWWHKNAFRSEAYVKRYYRNQLYDMRVAQNRAKGINV